MDRADLRTLGAGRAVTFGGTRFCFRRFLFAILRRRLRFEIVEQPPGHVRDLVDRARERFVFAFDGAVKPLSLRTNCNDAARTSSSVAGGSKLKSVLMFLHMAKRHSAECLRLVLIPDP